MNDLKDKFHSIYIMCEPKISWTALCLSMLHFEVTISFLDLSYEIYIYLENQICFYISGLCTPERFLNYISMSSIKPQTLSSGGHFKSHSNMFYSKSTITILGSYNHKTLNLSHSCTKVTTI